MKTNKVLLIGGSALLLYLYLKNKSSNAAHAPKIVNNNVPLNLHAQQTQSINIQNPISFDTLTHTLVSNANTNIAPVIKAANIPKTSITHWFCNQSTGDSFWNNLTDKVVFPVDAPKNANQTIKDAWAYFYTYGNGYLWIIPSNYDEKGLYLIKTLAYFGGRVTPSAPTFAYYIVNKSYTVIKEISFYQAYDNALQLTDIENAPLQTFLFDYGLGRNYSTIPTVTELTCT